MKILSGRWRIVLVFFFVVGGMFFVHAGEMRVWTAKDGKQVKAELTGYDPVEKTANMKVKDGKELTFPIGSLSKGDQNFVRRNAPLAEAKQIARFNGLIQKSLPQNSPFQNKLTDAEFLARAYPQIVGRKATPQELIKFSQNTKAEKRENLVESLLSRDEFVDHFISGFVGELLLVGDSSPAQVAFSKCESKKGQAEIEESKRMLFRNHEPEIYSNWVRQQIGADRPWDEMIFELISAKGLYSENPAVGYLLTENGNSMVNPSRIFSSFLGVEITCAQCHNHPKEEVYQKDFYQIAAFIGEVQFERMLPITESFDVRISDNLDKRVRLPSSYQYDDGEPAGAVFPKIYFGSKIDHKKHSSKREAFAAWLSDSRNPRFTVNIANRLVKYVYGTAPFEPVNNLPGKLAGKPDKVEFLESALDLIQLKEFRLKEVLRVMYRSDPYLGK